MISPYCAPPVFKMRPPVLVWPWDPTLRGAAVLAPGGGERGSEKPQTIRENNKINTSSENIVDGDLRYDIRVNPIMSKRKIVA